jgi:hypothetical protein
MVLWAVWEACLVAAVGYAIAGWIGVVLGLPVGFASTALLFASGRETLSKTGRWIDRSWWF